LGVFPLRPVHVDGPLLPLLQSVLFQEGVRLPFPHPCVLGVFLPTGTLFFFFVKLSLPLSGLIPREFFTINGVFSFRVSGNPFFFPQVIFFRGCFVRSDAPLLSYKFFPFVVHLLCLADWKYYYRGPHVNFLLLHRDNLTLQLKSLAPLSSRIDPSSPLFPSFLPLTCRRGRVRWESQLLAGPVSVMRSFFSALNGVFVFFPFLFFYETIKDCWPEELVPSPFSSFKVFPCVHHPVSLSGPEVSPKLNGILL